MMEFGKGKPRRSLNKKAFGKNDGLSSRSGLPYDGLSQDWMMDSSTSDGVNAGGLMTDHLLLGEELVLFLGNVAGNRAGLVTLGVPQMYPELSTLIQNAQSSRGTQALKLLSKVGAGLGDLLDTIAFDLNLSKVSPEPEPYVYTEANKTVSKGSLKTDTDIKMNTEKESGDLTGAVVGLRKIGGECPLNQLKKVRDSLNLTRLDLEHLESLNLSEASEHKQELHRDALLWCQSLYRQGIKIEKSLEVSVLEDQIQKTMIEQAKIDPCSHEYLKTLLDIENMELRKIRVLEEQILEERTLINKEMGYLRQELEPLEPNSLTFKTLWEKLETLREEEDMLGSA